MELGRAEGLFQKLVCTNGAEAVELLEHVATLTRQRADALRRQGSRKWTPGSGQPFVLLVIDELADVIAYQPDNGLRKRAILALQSILSQGRAPGVCDRAAPGPPQGDHRLSSSVPGQDRHATG
jgi:S-DNA-T family DNA segregation ATPase FtsK/SpoIIIE